jgi:hypothetical protein
MIADFLAFSQILIRIEAIKDVKKYLEVVGTSNPKHLKRYLN